MPWQVIPPSAAPTNPSTTYSAWGPSPPASGALRVDASTFSGIGINITGSTSNILTGALTGVTTLNGQTISATAAFTGTMTIVGGVRVGSPTGGFPAAGVINAQGFKINGVDVGTSSDTYWNAGASGIYYSAGPVGIGTTESTTVQLKVVGASLTTTNQTGIVVTNTGTSAATNSIVGINLSVATAAAAFTVLTSYGVYVTTPVVGAASAITSSFGIKITNQGATGITNAYGLYLDATSGAATANISLYNAGSSKFQGTIGMGLDPAVQIGFRISGTAAVVSSGNNAFGFFSDPTFDSNTTASGYCYYGTFKTAAAAFTVTSGYVMQIDPPTLGAGSAINTLYGIQVNNQGKTGITNTYGIYIAAQSGAATTNIGLYNLGTSRFDGIVGVGGAPNASKALYVLGSSLLTGTSQRGIDVTPTFSSASTTDITGVSTKLSTAVAAFTVTNGYGFWVAPPTIGVGSAVTSIKGLFIENQGTSGVTNAYGVYIAAQSGAATTNIGLYNGGGSQLVGNVGINKAPTTTSKLSISGIPTSAAGLASGDVWANSNVLTIVP